MKRLRCALLDDFQGVGTQLADWTPTADRVDVFSVREHCNDEDELVTAIGDAEIVVAMRERTRFSASTFNRLHSLRLLVTSGMRNRAIDLHSAEANGVTVCGTASLSTPPFELTWALILSLARSVPAENAAMRRNGPWQSTVGADLAGKVLGVLGLGRIGSRVARVGSAFDMEVISWSQNLTREKADTAGVEFASSKEELFERSDFLTIHVRSSDRTHGLVDAADLQRMKESAFLINTARSAIVDQEALIDALVNDRIAGAGLDVFDIEPLPDDHPFRTLPNVVATPHLGYVSEANYRIYYGEAVENVVAWLSGTPIRVLE